MRVLFVSHGSGLTGAELSLVDAVRALTRYGVEVHVALPQRGPLEQRLDHLAAEVIVAAHPWPWWTAEGPLNLRRRVRCCLDLSARTPRPLSDLRAAIRHVRPDVVITNTLTFPHAAAAGRLESVPHVWNVREFGREDHGLRHVLGDSYSFRMMGAMSSHVIACSKAVAETLGCHIRPSKIRAIYSAVETPELPRPTLRTNGPLNLLTLATLHPSKGQEDSIRATGILAARGLEVELSLVGRARGNYELVLEKLAAEPSARGRVTFHGFTTTPYAHLGRCDVLLMTSRCEAFGRAMIEAMKAARPVVAARSGVSIELVRDGWNGLLYRPGDVHDLAEQITRLYKDVPLRAQIGARAQQWAQETFTLDRYGADLLQVLSEAARSGRRHLA